MSTLAHDLLTELNLSRTDNDSTGGLELEELCERLSLIENAAANQAQAVLGRLQACGLVHTWSDVESIHLWYGLTDAGRAWLASATADSPLPPPTNDAKAQRLAKIQQAAQRAQAPQISIDDATPAEWDRAAAHLAAGVGAAAIAAKARKARQKVTQPSALRTSAARARVKRPAPITAPVVAILQSTALVTIERGQVRLQPLTPERAAQIRAVLEG